MQGQEAGILNVAAGQDRATLRWPYPLANPGRDNQRHQQGSGWFCPACREHRSEAALPAQPGDSDPKGRSRCSGGKGGQAQTTPPPRTGLLPARDQRTRSWWRGRGKRPPAACTRTGISEADTFKLLDSGCADATLDASSVEDYDPAEEIDAAHRSRGYDAARPIRPPRLAPEPIGHASATVTAGVRLNRRAGRRRPARSPVS